MIHVEKVASVTDAVYTGVPIFLMKNNEKIKWNFKRNPDKSTISCKKILWKHVV